MLEIGIDFKVENDFFNFGLVCHAKIGMGKKMAPHTTFSRKKWNGVPVLAAKNSTPLPKMELLFILQKVPILAA